MKKNFKWLVVACISALLVSCTGMKDKTNEPDPFKLTDLQGLWQNKTTETWHIRFTTEATQDAEYPFYGYEWGDFGDEVTEQDVLDDRYGNGWFMYQFEVSSGGLHEVHLMSNAGGEIPKFNYVVSKLTDTELEYYEKDSKNMKYAFSKLVETK